MYAGIVDELGDWTILIDEFLNKIRDIPSMCEIKLFKIDEVASGSDCGWIEVGPRRDGHPIRLY